MVRDSRLAGGGERASPYKALPRGRTATVSLVENIRRREKSRVVGTLPSIFDIVISQCCRKRYRQVRKLVIEDEATP